jgi:hypothetical protein
VVWLYADRIDTEKFHCAGGIARNRSVRSVEVATGDGNSISTFSDATRPMPLEMTGLRASKIPRAMIRVKGSSTGSGSVILVRCTAWTLK